MKKILLFALLCCSTMFSCTCGTVSNSSDTDSISDTIVTVDSIDSVG